MEMSDEIVYIPSEEERDTNEGKIRDVKDRPILRAVFVAKIFTFYSVEVIVISTQEVSRLASIIGYSSR